MAIRTTFGSLEALNLMAGRLLADIATLRSYGAPPLAQLEASPHLNHWSYSTRPVSCLEGFATDHPVLGSFVSVRTSDIMMIDETAGWVRTFSRFYTLGERVPLSPPS